MANLNRRTSPGLNTTEKRFDILSGRIDLHRPVLEIDAAVDETTVDSGMWMENTDTGLKFMADPAAAVSAVAILELGNQGYVKGSKDLFGKAYVSTAFGVYRAACGSDYYDTGATYLLGAELTVNTDGKLRPAAAGELVVAKVVEKDQSNMLRYNTIANQYKKA